MRAASRDAASLAVLSSTTNRGSIDLFNKDGLFGRKDEPVRNDGRTAVNVAPDLPSGLQTRTREAVPQRYEPAPVEEARAQPATYEPAGSKLIVGPDIKLKGVEITDCDTLVVEGRVEASMTSRVVQIAEDGVYAGTATMDVAEIRGTFDGTLTVREQLVIYATGRVSGEIRYGRLRIEEGGELTGDVRTLADPQRAPQRTVQTAAPAPAGAASPRTTPTGPAPASRAPTGAAASR